jgi:hypothetical protein
MVFGIEPARIEWGMELSPAVQRALPAVEEALYEALMLHRIEEIDPGRATAPDESAIPPAEAA